MRFRLIRPCLRHNNGPLTAWGFPDNGKGRGTYPLPCQVSEAVLKQTMRLKIGTKLATFSVMPVFQISKEPPHSSRTRLL